MREIKFRGKVLSGSKIGEWVYGYYLVNELTNEHKIHCKGSVGMSTYIVDAKTVGQYVGKENRWEEEIYEGDNVVATYGIPPVFVKAVVEYDGSAFVLKTPEHNPKVVTVSKAIEYFGELEIVGNIHEGA